MADLPWNKILQTPEQYGAYLLYSQYEYLLSDACNKIIAALQLRAADNEVTVLDGPLPDMEQAVTAAGMVSFFGTKRIVYLQYVQPSAMAQADADSLCELIKESESAVLVISVLLDEDDRKARGQKESAKFKATAQAVKEAGGCTAELLKPTPRAAKETVLMSAKALDTKISDAAAQQMVERVGVDTAALQNETAKLAAACGYTQITPELILQMGVQNIEADVFEMNRHIIGGRAAQAFAGLQKLLQCQNEPIAIAAALTSAFVDMLRAKAGAAAGKTPAQIHKECKYTGSDYRMKKAAENAGAYSLKQLRECMAIVTQLNRDLKSVPTDNKVLLQTAVQKLIDVRNA